jgi:hypothetical protein
MTETTTTEQAEIDAQTYAAYIRNGESKAATGRELEVSASTVARRVERHLARAAQDQATEPEPASPAAEAPAAETEAADPEVTGTAP